MIAWQHGAKQDLIEASPAPIAGSLAAIASTRDTARREVSNEYGVL